MDIEKAWEEWLAENPPESYKDVDEKQLTENIIRDLTTVSQMSVGEYTLYQKWEEVHFKYKTEVKQTLFGEELVMTDHDQWLEIQQTKKNIWIPESPDDYIKLKPVLEFTGDGNLSERWNTIRTFTSTMKNNSNIGRNMNFIVKDEVTDKYLGVICISSDFLDLTPRDQYIGWDRYSKTQGKMVGHTAIGSTIVPLQPLGYNYTGGKLLALMCLSDTIQNLWKEKYGDVLVGVTTTSLYGKDKKDGLSQYDNLDHWLKMGFTAGSVSYEPLRGTRLQIIDWIKKNHTRKYFEWYIAKKDSGQPYKRDHKNRSLTFAYSKLGVPKNLIKSEHARGIYFSTLYDNTKEFLCSQIKAEELVKSFDTSEHALGELWKQNHARGRIGFLKKKDRVSKETLFYDDLIMLSWDECREKYLGQVGR